MGRVRRELLDGSLPPMLNFLLVMMHLPELLTPVLLLLMVELLQETSTLLFTPTQRSMKMSLSANMQMCICKYTNTFPVICYGDLQCTICGTVISIFKLLPISSNCDFA